MVWLIYIYIFFFVDVSESIFQFCCGAGSYGGDDWFSNTSLYAITDVSSDVFLSNSNSSSLSGGGAGIINF